MKTWLLGSQLAAARGRIITFRCNKHEDCNTGNRCFSCSSSCSCGSDHKCHCNGQSSLGDAIVAHQRAQVEN